MAKVKAIKWEPGVAKLTPAQKANLRRGPAVGMLHKIMSTEELKRAEPRSKELAKLARIVNGILEQQGYSVYLGYQKK